MKIKIILAFVLILSLNITLNSIFAETPEYSQIYLNSDSLYCFLTEDGMALSDTTGSSNMSASDLLDEDGKKVPVLTEYNENQTNQLWRIETNAGGSFALINFKTGHYLITNKVLPNKVSWRQAATNNNWKIRGDSYKKLILAPCVDDINKIILSKFGQVKVDSINLTKYRYPFNIFEFADYAEDVTDIFDRFVFPVAEIVNSAVGIREPADNGNPEIPNSYFWELKAFNKTETDLKQTEFSSNIFTINGNHIISTQFFSVYNLSGILLHKDIREIVLPNGFYIFTSENKNVKVIIKNK